MVLWEAWGEIPLAYPTAGISQYRISKKSGISEASIRYHLKNGNLRLEKKTE